MFTSAGRRLGAALAGLILILAACGGGDDSPTNASGGAPSTTLTASPATSTTGVPGSTTPASGTVLAVTVRGGAVVEGAARQRATLNQPVTVRVTSDVADEVHIHGYDKMLVVGAGKTAEVTFVANIPGVFEVEFEKSKKLLFTLEVR